MKKIVSLLLALMLCFAYTVAPAEEAGGEESTPVQQEERAEEQPSEELPGETGSGEEQTGGEQPAEEQPGENEPGGDQPGENVPGEDVPGEDEPGEDESGEDVPGEDEPGEDVPGGDQPGEDEPGEGLPAEEGPRFEDLPPMFYRVTSEDAGVSDDVIIALSEAEYPAALFTEETQNALALLTDGDPSRLMCVELFTMQLEGFPLEGDMALTLRFTNASSSEETAETGEGIYLDWFETFAAVVCANGNEHVLSLTLTENGSLICVLDAGTAQDLVLDSENYIMILVC